MGWDDGRLDGFALGALLLGDRALTRVAVEPPVRAQLAVRLAQVPEDGPGKVAALRQLAGALRPPLGALEALPVRGRALLSGELPRDVGRAVLADAPPPRAGYEPPPDLTAALTRLAALARLP